MIQLKPYEQSFLVMARNLTKKFDYIILCEGKRDAEIIKILNNKLALQLGDNIAITHAEGIRNLLDLAKYIGVLARLSRKLKLLGILLDLDTKKPDERFHSIKDSLNAAGLHLENIEIPSPQVYNGLLKINRRSLDIKIALAGSMNLPFKRHMIEDHVVEAALLNGYISQSILNRFNDAKILLSTLSEDIEKILNNAEENALKETFKPLIIMLEKIKHITVTRQ